MVSPRVVGTVAVVTLLVIASGLGYAWQHQRAVFAACMEEHDDAHSCEHDDHEGHDHE